MQKFFSAFPRGSPGLGLLLLRALIVFRFFTADLNLPGWLLAVFAPAGICMLMGFLTPIAAVIIGVGALTAAILFSNSIAVVMAILAVAIALLGPGAFSVDARLFGRREIVIPHHAYKDSSDASNISSL